MICGKYDSLGITTKLEEVSYTTAVPCWKGRDHSLVSPRQTLPLVPHSGTIHRRLSFIIMCSLAQASATHCPALSADNCKSLPSFYATRRCEASVAESSLLHCLTMFSHMVVLNPHLFDP